MRHGVTDRHLRLDRLNQLHVHRLLHVLLLVGVGDRDVGAAGHQLNELQQPEPERAPLRFGERSKVERM
jgi:hypothetical protein